MMHPASWRHPASTHPALDKCTPDGAMYAPHRNTHRYEGHDMNIRRIAASVAVAATLLAGGAASADAARKPSTSGVKVCVTALQWAHSKPTAYREDRAVIICTYTVTTAKQARTLNKWAHAKGNRWALALIG